MHFAPKHGVMRAGLHKGGSPRRWCANGVVCGGLLVALSACSAAGQSSPGAGAEAQLRYPTLEEVIARYERTRGHEITREQIDEIVNHPIAPTYETAESRYQLQPDGEVAVMQEYPTMSVAKTRFGGLDPQILTLGDLPSEQYQSSELDPSLIAQDKITAIGAQGLWNHWQWHNDTRDSPYDLSFFQYSDIEPVYLVLYAPDTKDLFGYVGYGAEGPSLHYSGIHQYGAWVNSLGIDVSYDLSFEIPAPEDSSLNLQFARYARYANSYLRACGAINSLGGQAATARPDMKRPNAPLKMLVHDIAESLTVNVDDYLTSYNFGPKQFGLGPVKLSLLYLGVPNEPNGDYYVTPVDYLLDGAVETGGWHYDPDEAPVVNVTPVYSSPILTIEGTRRAWLDRTRELPPAAARPANRYVAIAPVDLPPAPAPVQEWLDLTAEQWRQTVLLPALQDLEQGEAANQTEGDDDDNQVVDFLEDLYGTDVDIPDEAFLITNVADDTPDYDCATPEWQQFFALQSFSFVADPSSEVSASGQGQGAAKTLDQIVWIEQALSKVDSVSDFMDDGDLEITDIDRRDWKTIRDMLRFSAVYAVNSFLARGKQIQGQTFLGAKYLQWFNTEERRREAVSRLFARLVYAWMIPLRSPDFLAQTFGVANTESFARAGAAYKAQLVATIDSLLADRDYLQDAFDESGAMVSRAEQRKARYFQTAAEVAELYWAWFRDAGLMEQF